MPHAIRRRRLYVLAGAAIAALALSGPARAAGPPPPSSGQTSSGQSSKSSPPSRTTLTPTIGLGGTASSPFSWIDDATIMAPERAAVTMSALGWQGSAASEFDAPVLGAAVGIAPRLQLGLSAPYVVGNDTSGVTSGWGTTYLSGKIGIVQSEGDGVKLAVIPTLQMLSTSALSSGQSRTQWGLPVSAEIDQGDARLYASAGYFSSGVGFAGGGAGVRVAPRVGLSASFSHSWSTTTPVIVGSAAPSRNDLTGSASFIVSSRIAAFGSVSRTLATADADGAGTTVMGGIMIVAGSSLR